MKNRRIAILGVGNLGKRYVESIVNIQFEKLFLYDLNHIDLDFLNDTHKKKGELLKKIIICETISNFRREINENTILIDCTTAKKRVKRLIPILKNPPFALILEKPVSQTHQEYLKLLKIVKAKNIKTVVNFTLRKQEIYNKIRRETLNLKSADIYISLPKMGLLCVGIHYIDLFFYLFGINSVEQLKNDYNYIYEQKRNFFYDVVGSIRLKKNNFTFYLINTETNNERAVYVNSPQKNFIVFEDKRVIFKVDKNGNTKTITNLKYNFVSEYMSEVIENLFKGKNVNLPNVEESYEQHKHIFYYLKSNEIENINFT